MEWEANKQQFMSIVRLDGTTPNGVHLSPEDIEQMMTWHDDRIAEERKEAYESQTTGTE